MSSHGVLIKIQYHFTFLFIKVFFSDALLFHEAKINCASLLVVKATINLECLKKYIVKFLKITHELLNNHLDLKIDR